MAHETSPTDWRLGEDSRVLVLCTEGATDAEAYEQIVGEAVRSGTA